MKLEDAVLNMLAFKGDFISGQDLANTLRVSRNAVWKAISRLVDCGYLIESNKSKGYKLSSENTRLCVAQIERFSVDTEIILLDSCGSTNDYAKQLANEGANENTLIIARKQTSGRGRLGRSFISEDGGLYMSLILRPTVKAEDCLQITVAAATAMSKAIKTVCDIDTKIKWVNDLYLSDKKICGILTEGAICVEDATLEYAVLGIGLNVAKPKGGFDKSIKDIATSLYDTENVSSLTYSKIIAEFLNNFFAYYYNLADKEYLSYFRENSFLSGKTVKYTKDGKEYTGTVIGVDDNAGLTVECDGKTDTLTSGEANIIKFNRQ